MVSKKKYLARRITDYIGTVILVFLLIFIWQLYRSPIPLPFLKPYIVKALNHDSQEYSVDVGSVNLELVRSIQPIKIIARDVAYKKSNQSIEINAPRIEISFSIKALVRGIISPSSVVFDKPSVLIYTSYGNADKTDMTLNEKKLAYYFDLFDRFLERFNSQDLSYPESYINYIAIKNANFEFNEVDLNRKWSIEKGNYVFDREKGDINIGLDGSFVVGESLVPLDLDIKYIPVTEKIEIDFAFSNLLPSEAVDAFYLSQDKNKLYKIDIPMSGKIESTIDFKKVLKNKDNIAKSLDNAIDNLDFKFEGGDGKILFSEQSEFNYDVKSFILQGEVKSGLNEIKIKNAKFDLGDKNALIGLEISGFRDFILKDSMENLKIRLDTEIEKFSFEELPKYWPRYIAEDAWNWVSYSIYSGTIKDAHFNFNFAYNKKSKSIVFKELGGSGYIENASIDYLEGMPHAKNVYGKANFFNDKIVIDIDEGESAGNVVSGGKVVLYDLDKYDNFISIELKASGKISDALKLIDSQPLEFAKEMGIEPETISGNANVDLKLDFELKKNLTPQEVKVDVKSKLFNVEISDIIEDKTIKAKELNLTVNNKSLDVRGDVTVDDVAMTIDWTKSFIHTKYLNKYLVKLKLDNKLKKTFGLDFALLQKPYFEGDNIIQAQIFEYANDKYVINVSSDLKQNKIDYSFFGFIKDKGEDGKLDLAVEVQKNKLIKISDIKLSKEDFEIEASLELDKNGNLEVVEVSKIKGPRTNAKAKVSISEVDKKEFIKVNVSGISYDISKLFDFATKQKIENTKNDNAEDSLKKLPNMDINIAVDSLWTNPEIPITNFAGTSKIRNKIGFEEIQMVGNYGHDKNSNFRFEYAPRPNDEHLINITSTDAGKTLKVLRLYDHMDGGNLKITARREANEKIVGYAKVRQFNIKNTNVMAKILSMASLSGIMNTISGEGIAFAYFDAQFDFNHSILELHETKAFGNVVGISADGYYDYETNAIGIGGMLAPAYSINRFIASIPLIGNLLSGKDGTVFAATYSVSGTTENPKIKIDPLSAIRPNSIKELFSKNEEE